MLDYLPTYFSLLVAPIYYVGAIPLVWSTTTPTPTALIACAGTKQQFFNCTHTLLGPDSCGQLENFTTAAVVCQDKSKGTDNDVLTT